MQAADAVLSNHPTGSAATHSLAQILVQQKKMPTFKHLDEQKFKQHLDEEIRVTGELINEWDREDRAAIWRAQKAAEVWNNEHLANIIKLEKMGWGPSGSPW